MKVLPTIKTKKQLFQYYLPQYSEKSLRVYINDVIAQYRPNVSPKCKTISLQEFLTFVSLYGTPAGFALSEEHKTEIENRKLKV